MKTLLSIILLFSLAPRAFSQLDKILAPLPDGSELASQEGTLVNSMERNSDTQSPVKAGATVSLLKEADLLSHLEKEITGYYALRGDFKLDFARPWQPIRLPSNDFDVVITEYPMQGLSSAFLVRCKITSGGETVGEWELSLRAQLWQEVWGTLSRVEKGQPLNHSLVAVQKVDVLRDKQAYLPADADPEVYDVAQGVPAGRLLAKGDVNARPLIHKGQVVEVIGQHGLLAIHMKAAALEDGTANDLIKMRNLDSHNEFNAQVINENQVAVNF